MGRRIYVTSRYKKDLKRASKRGKDLDKLDEIIVLLQQDISLHSRHLDHHLTGSWNDQRECHIEPDWLLIYKRQNNDLILTRIGSHSDLFP